MKKIVNLEIRDYVIRFTELHKKKNEVERMGEFMIPSGVIERGIIQQPQAFRKILHSCVKKWRLKGKQIRFTMPDSLVTIRKQEIPHKIEKKDIHYYVKFQLGDTIHLPFERPLFEIILLNNNDENYEISIVSTCEKLLNTYLEVFKKEKLKTIAVDISPLNYFRMFEQQKKVQEDDQTLLVQYHAKNVVFSAFEKQVPIFIQEFKLNGEPEVNTSISKDDLNRKDVFTELEQIKVEIDRIQRFYQYSMSHDQQPFNKIAIVGDHPFLAEIIDHLSEVLEINVITLPEEKVEGPKGIKVESKFHNVYGLAMKDVV